MDDRLRFDHLARLATPSGLFEHALGVTPRVEHGMCVDDVARALIVAVRTPEPDAALVALTDVFLAFLRDARAARGLLHNRRTAEGAWVDVPSSDDHWGRALWAWGTAARRSSSASVVVEARIAARDAMAARSPHVRAMAYAALGAAHVLAVAPDDTHAFALLADARTALRTDGPRPGAAWPYGRLTYANAVLPEAMVAIGDALGDDDLLRDGLTLLAWLVQEQTVGEHLSVVPAGGRASGDARPGFDQQPIEVACLAEAASTAWAATGDDRWLGVLGMCVAWFEGDNDSRLPMRDAATGGAFDGLHRGAVNANQGAESTLAWLATQQLGLAGVRVVSR
ncbi:glycosyltransferase [Cellulomonas rhizosphaerae]|uniref:Glycosyltransferase n=1 Tax=Cellulomonas rhizosphaerae TaxID=2293719 RepID=A0A413RMZ7_9CELL|nr:glycosyltransferase [Cellulomonas rhizosphaerae]RHA42673.1 glycosyltransferase [Cellulomonas rhizosphaerae]